MKTLPCDYNSGELRHFDLQNFFGQNIDEEKRFFHEMREFENLDPVDADHLEKQFWKVPILSFSPKSAEEGNGQ